MGLPAIYSPAYVVDIGAHVFPTLKYAEVARRLVAEGVIAEADVEEPEQASDADVLLVHTRDYVDKLRRGTLSEREIMLLEIPWTPAMARSAFLSVGGTTLTARRARERGLAAHVGGGFHHAFPDHGEGFCVFHDVAIAARRLLADGAIARALVVDCDVHHGNGTAAIFRDDPRVVTFSIHQENNYPFVKPPSDVDVGLDDGADGEDYLAALRAHVPRLLEQGKPDVVFYVAGADPYREDQLGGLALTLDDLEARDRFVIGAARDQGAALVITLAGGYARRLADTVEIHVRTIRVAAERLQAEESARDA